MVKVKICGLSRMCDIEAVNTEQPDYIGFVFADSRRKVTPEQALKLREKLHPFITPVGVFVDEQPENILSLVQNGVIEMIQLHGAEDGEYIKALKRMTDKPIIKANGNTASLADYLLFDNVKPGSGQAFDWASIGKIDRPFFLAGGLDINNIGGAIKKTTPFAVDISSGVETNGLKDPVKIKDFIRVVRNA